MAHRIIPASRMSNNLKAESILKLLVQYYDKIFQEKNKHLSTLTSNSVFDSNLTNLMTGIHKLNLDIRTRDLTTLNPYEPYYRILLIVENKDLEVTIFISKLVPLYAFYVLQKTDIIHSSAIINLLKSYQNRTNSEYYSLLEKVTEAINLSLQDYSEIDAKLSLSPIDVYNTTPYLESFEENSRYLFFALFSDRFW